MKISNRLLAIASFIEDNSFVMDVGADHGQLEVYLCDHRNLNGLIAVENKVGPYSILKNALQGTDVECVLGDGIKQIRDEVDTVIIAGMGGNLIVDILTNDVSKLKNVKHIVVDAHRDNELVRREIVKLGYRIDAEKIVYENKKYYFVISFKKGSAKYSDVQYEFGTCHKDPLFKQFKEFELNKLKQELAKSGEAKTPNKVKIEKLKAKIVRLENYGND